MVSFGGVIIKYDLSLYTHLLIVDIDHIEDKKRKSSESTSMIRRFCGVEFRFQAGL